MRPRTAWSEGARSGEVPRQTGFEGEFDAGGSPDDSAS